MIKAIIFDCFGVILQRPGHEFYKTVEDRELQKQIDKLEDQADVGEITEDEFNEQVAKLTGSTPAKVAAETSIYERNQELLNFVAELRGEYKVSLLTNVSKDTISRFFSEDERRDLFDDVLVSSEVGLVKPDPEIFALAARRLALRPEECVFIDDTAKNCEAAAKCGIKAIAYMGNKHTMRMVKQFLFEEQHD